MSRISLNTDQKSVHIRDLVFDDARAHRVLSLEAPDQVERKLRDALTIGFLAIDRTAAMSEPDWVAQRLEAQIAAVNYALERRAQEMMDMVRGHFDPDRAGSLIAPMCDLVQRTQADLSGKLTEAVTAIHASHTKLEGALDPRSAGTVLGSFLARFEALSGELSSSPLLRAKIDELRDEVKGMVTAMKVGVVAERAIDDVRDQMTQSSTLKGMVFEDEVRDQLKRIAEIRSDLIEMVGTLPGKGSSKKGDLIYYVEQTKSRIVFELKDYSSSRFTFDKIKDLMADSKSNRDALYGVFMVKDESCLPDGVGRFHVTDEFLVATVEHLEIAIKLAILVTHQKIARMGCSSGLDRLSIEMNLQELKSGVEELSDLESGCATAQKAITKTADGIRRVSRSLLEKVETLLTAITKKEAS